MTGYELRLWRKSFFWDQERAAEEIGVSLRTYKTYEKKRGDISKTVELATCAVSLKYLYPTLRSLPVERVLQQIGTVVPS